MELAIAALGIAGTLAGALIGAVVGYRLQEGGERRRRLQDACEVIVAVSLEGIIAFEQQEVERAGGPKAPDLRLDLGRDAMLANARLRITGPQALVSAAGDLSAAMQAATLAQATGATPKEREAGRQSAKDAIGTFSNAVRAAIGGQV